MDGSSRAQTFYSCLGRVFKQRGQDWAAETIKCLPDIHRTFVRLKSSLFTVEIVHFCTFLTPFCLLRGTIPAV